MSTLTEPDDHLVAPRDERRPPSLPRLVEVELRKAVDTRAGFWLLLSIGILACTVVTLRLSLGHRGDRTLEAVVAIGQAPGELLLSVLGILLVTSEWSQRTALTTFSLVPRRDRVIGAKLLAMLALAVVVTAAGVVASLVGFAAGSAAGTASGGWHLPAVMIPQLLLSQGLAMLMGAAFGLLLVNSAAAIVLSFALPTAWSVLGNLITALHTSAQWLDPNRTLTPLSAPAALTVQQWEHAGTSLCLWLLLPLVLGVLRLRRKEIS